MARLDGKVAFVTGAASGIGFATALRFAREGAVVVGLDLATCPDWKQVTDAAPATGFHVADVRDAAAQNAAVASAVKDHGRIDVLVSAAGIAGGGPVHLVSAEDWQRVQDVNLTGTFLSAKAVLPSMLAQRSGSIVTIASVEGIEGAEGGSTYNASKGGVILLTKNMAMDYGRMGIRVNCICPGFIDTPLFRQVIGSDAFPSASASSTSSGASGVPRRSPGLRCSSPPRMPRSSRAWRCRSTADSPQGTRWASSS